MNETHQSGNVSTVGVSSPTAVSSETASGNIDRPLHNHPSLALSDLDTRETQLRTELETIQRERERQAAEAARRKAEEEAVATRALHQKVRELPSYLGISGDHNEVIRLIRLVTSSRPAGRKGHEIDPDARVQIDAAIKGGATEKEVVSRWKIGNSTYWAFRKRLGIKGRVKSRKVMPTPTPVKNGAKTRKTKGRPKSIKASRSKGKRKAPPPPYPKETKEAVLRALSLGASIPSIHRVTGISEPGLALWKARAGYSHKNLGRVDVEVLIRDGKIPPLPKAA